MAIMNVECDKRDKSSLQSNVKNNSPVPPCIPHDNTVCIINGKNITESVGKIISNKTSHRELKSLLYNILILHRNTFDLVLGSI